MKLKFDPYKFEIDSMHGVPVYWKNIPWANGFVYVNIIWTIGSRHDPVGKEGVAHFLEHMPFLGCSGYPTFKEIEKVDRRLFFKSLHGVTSYEYTSYHGKVSMEKFPEAMEFLRYFVFEPTLDVAQVEHERKVITRELWGRYGSEKQESLERHLHKISMGDHTLSRMKSAMGWHDTIAGITVEDMRNFHTTHYKSANLKMLLVGDIDETSLAHIGAFTEHVPVGQSVERPANVSEWPNPVPNEVRISISEHFGLAGASVPRNSHVKVSRGMPLPENKEILGLTSRLLRQILFTRLRRALRATYSPSSSSEILVDHCSISAEVGCDPQMLEAVRNIISDTIREIAAGDPLHESIFDEVKSTCLENKKFLDPSVREIASESRSELAVSGGITTVMHDYEEVSRLQYGDIVALFAKEFNPEQLFWTIMTP